MWLLFTSVENRLQTGRNGSRGNNLEAAVMQRRNSSRLDLNGNSKGGEKWTDVASRTNRICTFEYGD